MIPLFVPLLSVPVMRLSLSNVLLEELFVYIFFHCGRPVSLHRHVVVRVLDLYEH